MKTHANTRNIDSTPTSSTDLCSVVDIVRDGGVQIKPAGIMIGMKDEKVYVTVSILTMIREIKGKWEPKNLDPKTQEDISRDLRIRE